MLAKNNKLGKITVTRKLIADLVGEVISMPKFRNDIFASTKRGTLINIPQKIMDPELSQSIDSDLQDDGSLIIELSIIVRFGVSIRRITKDFSDAVCEKIYDTLGIKVTRVIVNIAGVKSKQIAKRNTRVVTDYACD